MMAEVFTVAYSEHEYYIFYVYQQIKRTLARIFRTRQPLQQDGYELVNVETKDMEEEGEKPRLNRFMFVNLLSPDNGVTLLIMMVLVLVALILIVKYVYVY